MDKSKHDCPTTRTPDQIIEDGYHMASIPVHQRQLIHNPPEPVMIRYLVIGGTVRSRTDGQEHYVNARRLIELYKVPRNECYCTEEATEDEDCLGIDRSTLIVLRPDYTGTYAIPAGAGHE